MDISERIQHAREETANWVTHGLGTALSITALAVMLNAAALRGSAKEIVGAAIFGSSLLILYLMSTLYHGLKSPRAKRLFNTLDHASIYLLIAGTYTPFCLSTLKGRVGWSLFGVVWAVAVVGICFEWVRPSRSRTVSVAIYMAMGWLMVFAARPLYAALPEAGLLWLLGGAACYSLGTIFYARKRFLYHHAVWHLFVLGGSGCHVMAVLGSVIPVRG